MPASTPITDPEALTALHGLLANARWFAGKGREFTVESVDDLGHGFHLVRVGYADGPEESRTETYTVPLSSYDEQVDRLQHAYVGEWAGRHHYDGVHDRDLAATWLEAFAEQASSEALTFSALPGHELDLDVHSTLFSGEQSNSSLAFGEDSLLKVFRKVTPGLNPDVEIHRTLTEAGSDHVAALYGWLSADIGGGEMHLGMLQQFLRTSTEGWELALASVRVLLAEADLHPDEVGGDFASEAELLGRAVAEVHATLRGAFGTTALDTAGISERMRERLAAQVREVPEIAPHAEAVDARFAALAAGVEAAAQRVHGDLHLGQTLRTTAGWKLVDFEGEPAKPLAERVLPDSPWRDVAGMLRSFDYAARSVQRDLDGDPALAQQMAYRAQEWVGRTRTAFLAGYADATQPLTESDLALIEAYELDKAVYEAAYEARNRPTWLGIPLAALASVSGVTGADDE